MAARIKTADKILSVAESLVRTRGYNGFSYSDIAAQLDISKPTIHHHFATKEELAKALVEAYARNFSAALGQIGQSPMTGLEKLRGYIDLYGAALQEHKMCLFGMLAAEHESFSPELRTQIAVAFDEQYAWLSEVLSTGRDNGELRFSGPPMQHAHLIVTNLQGALLLAKSLGSPEPFHSSASVLIETYRIDASA